MAGIYDVHCHLNDNLYIGLDISSSELVKDASEAGVSLLNSVGFDIKSSKLATLQAETHQNVYAVIGIHPNDVHLFTDEAYSQLDSLANATKVVAIGEIGLDYTRTDKYKEVQKQAFSKQLEIALKHKLPVVLHFADVKNSKKAYEDGIEILKKQPPIFGAVVHSFSGDWELAAKFLDLNCYLSFSGDITHNKELQDVVRKTSLNWMMVESDAPYKAPKPYDKKINYPRFLKITINMIAKLKTLSPEVVIATTRDNGKKLFQIPIKE